DAEHGQTCEVDGGGSGVDVGSYAAQTATSSFAAAPESAGDVRELAFHHGPVGPVALGPFGRGLFGAGGLEQRFVAVNGDRPSPPGRGAAFAQRAGLAVASEAGFAAATASRCDR